MKKRWTTYVLIIVALAFLTFNASAQDNSSYALRTVVIDAGHGGKDPGAQANGMKEKDITLDISLKLGNYIRANCPDVEVIYTRDTDQFLELKKRAKLANSVNADLFISIHVNAAGSTSAKGTETYVLGLHRSEDNLAVAKRENSSILLEDDYQTNYGGFDPNSPESHILLMLMQDAHLEQSIKFATNIQTDFAIRGGRRTRGVKQAGFLVLRQTTMPSVLIEVGFLTNPEEADYLGTDLGRSYLASSIFRAFRDYKEKVDANAMETFAASSTPIENTIPLEEVNIENLSKTSASDIFYSVQVSASAQPIDKDDSRFSDYEVHELHTSETNMYKYLVGISNDYAETIDLQNRLRNDIFKDAFIVAYKNGQRISINDALSLAKTN